MRLWPRRWPLSACRMPPPAPQTVALHKPTKVNYVGQPALLDWLRGGRAAGLTRLSHHVSIRPRCLLPMILLHVASDVTFITV